MIQTRPPGGGPPYAPARDLVNLFPTIARKAAYCMDTQWREPWFDDYIRSANISDEELANSVVALANYINQCRKSELDTPMQTLEASGFLALSTVAQMAILSKVGQVTMAMFYATSRDALRSDEKPMGMDALLETAEKVSDALSNKK